MKRPLVLISLCCLFVLLVSFTGTRYSHSAVAIPPALPKPVASPITIDHSIELYTVLNLEEKGLSLEAFEYAWKGYEYLSAHDMISNVDYLTICDFSQSSKQKRLYLIDLANNELVMNTWVAHGRNSGMDYATRFSNKPESLQSSLGFYVTGQTYTGEHGLSLRVQGVEPGFNDKAYARAIVVHGADYIGEDRLDNSSFMGRSYGCPAVPAKESTALIEKIKNGSCLFIYNPDKNYLQRSTILND